MSALNLSHLVIATGDVPRMARCFATVFSVEPRYSNDEFADFVLPSGARIAFFRPVGKSAKFFDAAGARGATAIGITVHGIDRFYERCAGLASELGLDFSGPPKEHPWGEPSFLLIDCDGNRWEVTESPSKEGVLTDRNE